jgi:glycosyltransferase involved in cell wall biosynthesis
VTIWYDFTTTVRNRGRNGIANVEWNIGQALLAASPDARCFELRGRRGLVELDRSTRLAAAVYASSDVPAPGILVAVPTWRDRLRTGLYSRLGRRADPLIRGLSSVYQLPVEMRRLPSRARALAAGRDRPARLLDLVQPGDVVISMGADWGGDLAARMLELKRRSGCVVVTMVYDLVPLTHTHLAFHNDPGLFVRYYRMLVEVSDAITCISEQSRRDLIEFASERGLDMEHTAVLRLGESPPPATVGSPPPQGDFFLCVGTIERRKNLELIYDALRILESEGHDLPTVVVAGAMGWGTADLLEELGQQSTAASRAIVLLGSIDDATLDHLYRTTRALLFPSHFEGWGLPVREAAVRGCPVAAGDSPATREAAAGYAGATFLPADDAGPWADYLLAMPPAVEPTSVRPWADVAADLLALASAAALGVGATDAPVDDGPSR